MKKRLLAIDIRLSALIQPEFIPIPDGLLN